MEYRELAKRAELAESMGDDLEAGDLGEALTDLAETLDEPLDLVDELDAFALPMGGGMFGEGDCPLDPDGFGEEAA